MKKIRGGKPIGVIIHIYMEISQGNTLYRYLYLKHTKMSCFSLYLLSFFSTKSENRKVEQVLPRGESWHQWKEEVMGKRDRRVNAVHKMCKHISKSKMIPVETTPGIRGGRDEEW
jgi:hypothetical protein